MLFDRAEMCENVGNLKHKKKKRVENLVPATLFNFFHGLAFGAGNYSSSCISKNTYQNITNRQRSNTNTS